MHIIWKAASSQAPNHPIRREEREKERVRRAGRKGREDKEVAEEG